MARYRTQPIDPFLALLMQESGCATMKEASERTGIPLQNLTSFANKGVTRLNTMAKLARLFDVDMQVVSEWITNRLIELADEPDLSETA